MAHKLVRFLCPMAIARPWPFIDAPRPRRGGQLFFGAPRPGPLTALIAGVGASMRPNAQCRKKELAALQRLRLLVEAQDAVERGLSRVARAGVPVTPVGGLRWGETRQP